MMITSLPPTKRKTAILILAGVALSQFALAGCNQVAYSVPNPNPPAPVATPAPHIADNSVIDDMASRQDHLAFDLLHSVDAKAGNENSFISPLSISQAMTMLYDGASSNTKSEIGKALYFDGISPTQVNQGTDQLRRYINGTDPTVQIEIANAIWADKRMSFLQPYQDICAQYFDASATTLDFTSASAADTINKWTSTHTHGKITSIVSPHNLTAAGAVLTDAVYFHGKWQNPFDEANTQQQSFTLGSGSKKMMPLMVKTSSYLYAENDICQAVNVPYGDGSTSMWVVLPKTGHSIDGLVSQMDYDNAQALANSASYKHVELHLPKFHVETSVSLNDALKNLGVNSAFTPMADFSPMSNTPLYVSEVLHKATLDVDEKGTVATAVTGIAMTSSAMMGPQSPPIVVNVDHPFLVAIVEKQSGAILFLGAIRDPQAITTPTE